MKLTITHTFGHLLHSLLSLSNIPNHSRIHFDASLVEKDGKFVLEVTPEKTYDPKYVDYDADFLALIAFREDTHIEVAEEYGRTSLGLLDEAYERMARRIESFIQHYVDVERSMPDAYRDASYGDSNPEDENYIDTDNYSKYVFSKFSEKFGEDHKIFYKLYK